MGVVDCHDHLAAQSSCARSDVDDIVCSTDNLLVMFDDNDRVAEVAQAFQHADELLGIAGMESYRWFIEDIHRAHEGAAQRCRQVNALAFAAREGIGKSTQGEVAQSDVNQVSHAVDQLLHDARRQLTFVLRQGVMVARRILRRCIMVARRILRRCNII